ncbi:hypothetical protein CFR78_05075 [Komagataeibacter rhaeticus]|uniref:Uncharacterized protein n=1 Tax=Komagataeibacter rhaeticus TaxID=215221 RepID=A0A181C9S0_9PROT|nr:hypothetical protein [Komagataeibacter rhaeticus]ATU73099.1 hypothetical protein CT154_09910 [Komagataeibacter xylinus]EGG77034.1 hypothetical protein SXCC_02245 [Gluconacetobacter sp. SXCC-1]KDU96302.1 hypothetical protein GLUCORHAEAF1_03295 [Komagataeibacter rhaeticus AF1]MBL7239513.1 hypothetical protein [Komagataeibacter rhaeticus]PYD54323.1 hypothetical protein CFR78_05075 [Komagataeibacter rhaeticus]
MISHPLAFMRLPYEVLVALDSRMLHFWLQPVHYLIRIVHIISMALFFGMDMLFDFGILNRRMAGRIAPTAQLMVRPLHVNLAIAMVTGVILFLYDPVHIGSRAYLTPKLLLITLALLNAWWCHRSVYLSVLRGDAAPTLHGQTGACLSLCLWIGVMVMSCLNSEGVPKVFLR